MSMRKLSVVTLLLTVVAAVALMITAMDGERTGSSSLTEVRLMDWGGEAGVASSRYALAFQLRQLKVERMSAARRMREVETELLELERDLRDLEHTVTPETMLQVEYDFLEPGRRGIEDLQAILSALRGELTDMDVTIASLAASMAQHDRDLAQTTPDLARPPSFE